MCQPNANDLKQRPYVSNIIYFLSMRMKQSDWLIRLSQRAVFLHPARCEMQPARCEIQPNLCEKL